MLILLTLRGTPTLYYGDELGLENVPIAPGQGQDPFGLAHPDQGRDPVRTPMPWHADGPHAGFTDGDPWLPLGADHPGRSIAVQRADPGSMLTLTRNILALRRQEPALAAGDWSEVAIEGDVLAYARSDGNRRFVILANLTSTARTATSSDPIEGEIVLSTIEGRTGGTVSRSVDLLPDEALIVRAG
jgi:alpha-glucosidase